MSCVALQSVFLLASGDPAAGAAAHGDSRFALDLLVVLATAALVSMFVRRLKLATIPGYLIAGALIGPHGVRALFEFLGASESVLGVVSAMSVAEGENIEQIKQLAVVLLMFTIGLHLDIAALSTGLVHILAVGLVSTLGVIALGWPVAVVLGAPAPAALAIAMALAMSSTAVVLRLLAQKRETHRMHGRVCVGVAIVQDLVALAVLASLPLLARWASAGAPSPGPAGAATGGSELVEAIRAAQAIEPRSVWDLVVGAVLALLSITLLIVFGRYALPRLLQEAAREPTGEATLVLSAAVAIGAAVLTASRGFSPELGAFLAGFLLSSTPFRYHLAGQLSPLRDLFMAVFFTAVGLKLDVAILKHAWAAIVFGLPALVAIKAGMIGLCTWAAGATAPVSGRAGFALANAGEFSIVILGLASAQGVVTSSEQTVAITLVVLSLMITPSLYDLGATVQPWLARIKPAAMWRTGSALREAAEPAGDGATGGASGTAAGGTGKPKASRAIIAGYGVVGRTVADHLEVNGVPFTIVELNARTVETQASLGRPVVFGDIGNPEVLEKAGIREADAVFLTIPDDDAVMRACQAIRGLAPSVFIAARTTYLSTAFMASAAGADDVTTAEVATAEAMAKRVIERIKRMREHRKDAAVSSS